MTEQEVADISKALSVPSRLKILKILRERTLCVNAITRMINVSQPAVSQHLLVLKQAGLVIGKKEGNMIHYSFSKEKLRQFNRILAEIMKVDSEK